MPRVYTPNQLAALERMLAAGALDVESARPLSDDAMPTSSMVVGKLRSFGLVQSREVKAVAGRAQTTKYWLTPNGAAEANIQRIARAKAARAAYRETFGGGDT